MWLRSRLQALKARPRRRRLPPDLGERQAAAVAPNVLDRSFEAVAPNRKWIADFTCVWTAEGWLYVSAARLGSQVNAEPRRPICQTTPRCGKPRRWELNRKMRGIRVLSG